MLAICESRGSKCRINVCMYGREKVFQSSSPRSSPIGDRFVVVLSRQHLSSHSDANHVHQQHNPRDGAEDPTPIQLPADKEAVIMIEQESLYISSVNLPLVSTSSKNTTYHNPHGSNLANNHNAQETSTHLPASFSVASSSQQHNSKSDKGCQLEDDREVHQEAYASPHGAEVSVFAMAVFRDWERCAVRGERGAATVQTVGYVDRSGGVRGVGRGRHRTGVRDPVGESHRGKRQGDGWNEGWHISIYYRRASRRARSRRTC